MYISTQVRLREHRTAAIIPARCASQPTYQKERETMFGKKIEKDPQKALDNAKKTLNSGLTGGLTKAFMGKDFVNDMNSAMDKGQAALDMQKSGAWLAQSGMPATAVVESIKDTGQLINMN